jgi:hypothetical protein
MGNLGILVGLVTLSVGASPEIKHDEAAAQLSVMVDGETAIVYQYGSQYALPHYWPIQSPTGKQMTVQHPEPYPHHRSMWIADRVRKVGGPEVDFYHCWKNYRQQDSPAAGFRHFIEHRRFSRVGVDGDVAFVEADLRWVVNESEPVLDEQRTMRVVSLGDREYRVDLRWELRAAYGDVQFLSDAVHYAWPFVRMHPQFSVDGGAVMTNDHGGRNQKETDGKPALWIDYSATVDGISEGLALFIPADDGARKWLTRDYGTFGPRRVDAMSGVPFTLGRGESIVGEAALLVHRGDVTTGQVAKRYEEYLQSRKIK